VHTLNPVGSGLRIVVVDNDLDALELVVTDLTLEGHDVVGQATDGTSALDICRRVRPDVLVVDYRIPEPNGVSVAREVGARLPATSVLVYSNYQNSRLARDVQDAGAQLIAKGNLRRLRRAVARCAARG
jgi:DNA-binding NarL/FixJ family response regulator